MGVDYTLQAHEGELPARISRGRGASKLDINVARVKATADRYGKWNVIATYDKVNSIHGTKAGLRKRHPDVEFDHRIVDGVGVLYAKYEPA